MKAQFSKMPAAWLALALGSGLAAPASAATALYTVQDLGVLAGYSSSSATAINELGQVTGFVTNDAGATQAFIYSAATGIVGLGTLGGRSSYGWAINDAGQVVGASQTASGVQHAFLSNGAGLIDLTPGASSSTAAYGINNRGQIVGADGVPVTFDAAGGSSPISVKMGAFSLSASSGAAYAINEAGVSTGYAGFWSRASTYPYDMAFVSTPAADGSNLLPGIRTDTYSVARAINDAGVVVGYASGNGLSNPFVARNGTIAFLGSLSDCEMAGASAINNLGQIVGSSQSCASRTERGFIAGPGNTLIDLNTLLSPESTSWKILSAKGINEAGQIVGQGMIDGKLRAVLLTPSIPEPSTLVLMAVGLVAVATASRRRTLCT